MIVAQDAAQLWGSLAPALFPSCKVAKDFRLNITIDQGFTAASKEQENWSKLVCKSILRNPLLTPHIIHIGTDSHSGALTQDLRIQLINSHKHTSLYLQLVDDTVEGKLEVDFNLPFPKINLTRQLAHFNANGLRKSLVLQLIELDISLRTAQIISEMQFVQQHLDNMEQTVPEMPQQI
jgi:hypothetical protein